MSTLEQKLTTLRNEWRMRGHLRDMEGTITSRHAEALTTLLDGGEPDNVFAHIKDKYPLILYFKNKPDAQEFVAAVQEALPNLVGYDL